MSKIDEKALKENKSKNCINQDAFKLNKSKLSESKSQKDINSLIEITSQRIINIHQYYPLDDIEFDKIYLNNIRALSLLYKIKKDINSFDAKNTKIEIDYDAMLKSIINNKD